MIAVLASTGTEISVKSSLRAEIFDYSAELARCRSGHEGRFSLVGSLYRQGNSLVFRSGGGLYYDVIALPAFGKNVVLPDGQATSCVRLEAHQADSFRLVVHHIEAHRNPDLPKDQIVLERLLVIAAMRAHHERPSVQAARAS